MVECENTT